MKHTYALLGAALAVGFAPGAAAESNFYASVGYSALDSEFAELGAVTVRGGTELNTWFGLEGEASFGIDDDEVGGFTGTSVELNSAFAAFAVARTEPAPNVTLFARLGYGVANFDATLLTACPLIYPPPDCPESGEVSVDTDGVQFGVGGEWRFANAHGVRIDYTRFESDGRLFGDGIDTFSLSYVFRFSGAGG